MKVGVEASAIFRTGKTGVSWYAYNLVRALADAMPDDQLYLCYISFLGKQQERYEPSPANVKYRRISYFPGKIYNFLDHYLVPPPIDLLARAKNDVFFFPNYFRWPLWLCRRSVVVVHDLAYLEAPKYIVPRHQRYMSRRVPESVNKATHVVTVSEHTKQQLVKQYGVDEAKVTVVVPALDQAKYRPADEQAVTAVKEKYGIDKDYLLFVGTTDPRKNIDGLVKAYGMLPKKLLDKYQLVLAGAPGRDWSWGWLDEDIDQLEKTLPGGKLIRTGYFADEDKAALMTGAKLFLWPSHYEGWGMPVLEAMACGTPAVTARNSSLPEAGGEAAAYVEQTTDPAELSRLIESLLGDKQRLAEMREAGLKHAKQFTWEASAKVLAGVLRKTGQA